MAGNIAASMTASIVIDKKEIVSSALEAYASAQKELDGKKIELLIDVSSDEARKHLKKIQKELDGKNYIIRFHNQGIEETLKSFDVLEKRIKEVTSGISGSSGNTDLTKVNKIWDGFASQAANIFKSKDVLNLIGQAVDTIIELDTALVDLRKNSSMTGSELNDFYLSTNDIAKESGAATQEIISQANSLFKLGYSTKAAAAEMIKLSSQFASISPGMDTAQAQSGIVNIMKAFDIDVDEVKSEIMDNITVLSNSFSESNRDLIEGMQSSASALAAVGTDYKEAFALFTGAHEALQNAEAAGSALRSISMRIRGYSEDSGGGFREFDEELKNIADDLTNLTKTAGHTQGVSIFKEGSAAEFKNLADYFREINAVWDEMSEKQQNDYLQKAFGETQAQAGAALITNYQTVSDSLEKMRQSAGSADKEMEVFEQSLTYKANALKETWVGTAQTLVDQGDFGKVIDILTKLSEAIGFVIDKAGLLGTVEMGAGIFGITKFIKSFA